MRYQAWTVLALFWRVLAILTQATLFLTGAAKGLTACIAAAPKIFQVALGMAACFVISGVVLGCATPPGRG